MEDPTTVGCGLEDCRCQTLLNSIHPQGDFRDFPYLERGDLSEEGFSLLTSRLQRQYEEVVFAFQQLIPKTLTIIRDHKVTPEALVDFLEKIDGTRNHLESGLRHQPLYHQILNQLRQAKTTDEVFRDAHSYFCAFTYHVLTDIMVGFGNREANRYTVHRYVEKFNFYNQRPIVQAPRVFSSPRKHGRAFLVFYLDWDPNKYTVHELEAFRLNASFIFKLTHYVLMLISVEMKDKMMVQMYQIPASLRDILFPLDEKQLEFFESRKVLKVECCGTSAVTKIGEDFFKLLEEDRKSGDDANFVTPPSSPPHSRKATPIPDVIGTEPGYKLMTSKENLTDYEFELTKPGMDGKNYIAFIAEPSFNPLLIAMILCSHVATKRASKAFSKSLIVANTHRRALEILAELKKLLPDADIHCFTGAEETSITTKLCLDRTTTIVCTAGKLHSEFTSDAVSFKMMSLLVIDGCEYVHHETSLEDLMQIYLRAKGDETLGSKRPQIVGFTRHPEEGVYALREEGMVNHLVSLCGLLEATGGLLVTESVRAQVFRRRRTQSVTEMRVVRSRDVKQDCLSLLSVEMGRIEVEVEVVCLFEKWTEDYVTFMQQTKDGVKCLSEQAAQQRSVQLDLLIQYSQAMSICRGQGPNELLQFFEKCETQGLENVGASLADNGSLNRVRAELKEIVDKGAPVQTEVANFLSEKFKENSEWRGLLFVDSEDEAQHMLTEVSNKVIHARPTMISTSYLSVFSKRTKRKKDLEIVRSLCKEDSRLCIVPFSIETCDDPSLIDLPTCDFMIRFQKQYNENTRHMSEKEYIMTYISCSSRKVAYEFSEELQLALLEKTLNKIPTGEEFQTRMVKQQKLSMRNYVNRGYLIRRSLHSRKRTKAPRIDQFQLRCKKCRTYACHGNQLFTIFVDGAQNYVVPYHEFQMRFSLKRFHPKRKVVKRISRLRRIHCSNCNREWGMLCYFPKRGIELPVLKSKNFFFEANQQLYKIRMWADALFYVPPLTASSQYSGDQSDSD